MTRVREHGSKEIPISDVTLGPIPVRHVGEIDSLVPMTEAGRALVRRDLTLEQNIAVLLEANADADATRLFPFLLPVRRAIWWSSLCAWHGVGSKPSPTEDRALRAAVHWVQLPSEENRQAADAAAEADGLETAAGCCAKAVFWAGSLNANEDTWKANDVLVAAKLVAASAFLACGQAPQAGVGANLRQLLHLGVAVAQGKLTWEPIQKTWKA